MSHQNTRGGFPGRSRRPDGPYSHRYRHVGASKPFENDSFGSKERMSRGRGKNSHYISPGSGSKRFNDKPAAKYVYRPKRPPPDVGTTSPEVGGNNMKHKQPECFEASDPVCADDDLHSLSAPSDSKNVHLDVSGIQIRETPEKKAEDSSTFKPDFSGKVKVGHMLKESLISAKADAEDQASQEKGSNNSAGIGDSRFDICAPKTGNPVQLKPPLFVMNRQKRNEAKLSMEGQNGTELRSGMILLKKYLSLSDQVKIVKACRDLGLGPGGFYQPGYRDGSRLRLKMMCLGKNWDPETSKYEDIRSIDGAKPPIIPAKFDRFVSKAIQDSHALLKGNSEVRNVEDELPWMSPDICIVNFYSETGKLGLHQDRDESRESLEKGLPVVSFSIGDSAEFLYGDNRNVNKAEKVKLESGDVLIFGGKSRHIFHGVSTIIPDTAPKTLLEETNIRPGRLNLTFRQY